MGNIYRFVEPVVLYLLQRDGPSHGYELAMSLRQQAMTDAAVERAALYRTLKQLERQHYVQSQWDTSRAGPARHVYAITPAGAQQLADWVEVLEHIANTMQDFVNEAYGGQSRQKAPFRLGGTS